MFDHTPLHKVLEVEIDGKLIQLPHDAEGLVVINLDSYMGGTNIWGSRQDEVVPRALLKNTNCY